MCNECERRLAGKERVRGREKDGWMEGGREGGRERERERERAREREALITIEKRRKVGKYNAMTGTPQEKEGDERDGHKSFSLIHPQSSSSNAPLCLQPHQPPSPTHTPPPLPPRKPALKNIYGNFPPDITGKHHLQTPWRSGRCKYPLQTPPPLSTSNP